jgi:subfamily B ATP-binding cassette protein MsbA
MVAVSVTSMLQAYLVKPLFDDVLLGGAQAGSFVKASPLIRSLQGHYEAYLLWAQQHWSPRVAAVLIIFVVLFLKSVALFFSTYSFGVIGFSVVMDLRNHLYRRLLHQPLAFYGRESAGGLVSRIVSDVQYVQLAVGERFGDVFQETFTLLGLIVLLFSIDFKLALLALCMGPLFIFPIVRFIRSLRKASIRSQEKMAEMTSALTQTFIGARVVKAFTAEAFVYGRFEDLGRRQLKFNLKARRIHDLNGPILETLGITFALGMFVYAGALIDSGRMTVGSFSSFLAALFMLYQPIKKISKANLSIQQAVTAGERIFAMTDLHGEEETARGTRELGAVRQGIVLEGVSFTYGDKPVLQDVSLDIPRGRMVAVVGASGSGKTTLASLLAGFYRPTGGRITIDGVPLDEIRLDALRGGIGLVAQETLLFNDTVTANIAFGDRHPDDERVRRAARLAFAHDFIEALPQGYDTLVGDMGVLVSGGERQRIAIARALYKDPPILILDEATSSLDSNSERLVQQAIDSLLADRTALVIAHRLSTVVRAHRILVLEGGRVAEAGTHAELMARGGRYRALFDLQRGTFHD